jgi:hypothetical protein
MLQSDIGTPAKRRPHQLYIPRPLPAPVLEPCVIEEILDRVVPVDFIAAIGGRAGPVLHLLGTAS